MIKDSHAKQWSHQRRVHLLMYFQKNEHQLEKISHEKVVSHIHTKYSWKGISTKELHEKVAGHLLTKYDEKVKHHYKVVNKLNTNHKKIYNGTS